MSQQYSYGGGGGGGYGGGYGAPPPQQGGGYGQPPQQQGGAAYGAGGYAGAGPGAGAGGYGAPPQSGYGGAPPQQHQGGGGYGQGGYGGAQQQQQQPPGGYGRPQAFSSRTGPPPGADPQLWQWFVSVDRDQSGHINPTELSQALINGDWTPFDQDTVKMLMTVFDVDRSGQICFNEFAGLWKYIKDWQEVFRRFDSDRSGSIDQGELANALSSFGYRLSPNLLRILSQKYIDNTPSAPNPAAPGAAGGAAGGMAPGRNGQAGISFDRFLRCCVAVKTLTDSFARHDTQRTGFIQVNYDTFMEMCLSAP
ncbi:uncharacterized protein PFL1_02132 [Pseudozyma flocculosa PF-1]|uniref:Related to programmed cell death protein (Calcium-binding protein) n=1 Tax=Pseudozyma flocculosa TaxID=84751 RepID=A0A5C3F058_9BASI|nr:uncharacterized protein PFL1_02132 [Pseudozyma flocculosa PF-1]EPQ30608.1 hypothetical protein PFL1_02132 [Pseudozyma flocculosa PF-1]SPO37702.1 related to programmed cell death protein (calcium-binding protein) [Pseudozyma flocculosa]